jgi:hypothetical protein
MRSVNKVRRWALGKCLIRDFSERQGNWFRFNSKQFDKEGFINAFEMVDDG